MTDTKRQKIVDAVIARMQLIRTENGYETEAGARVEEWAQRFDQAELEEQPGKAIIAVYDLPDEVSKESMHSIGATHRLRMQVRIFISKSTPARELRKMIGDVVKAIGTDILWGYLARDTEPGSEGFIVPTDSMEVAGAAVEFVVVFNTATFDPYQ